MKWQIANNPNMIKFHLDLNSKPVENGIRPFNWLKRTLETIPSNPINKVKELLPHHWEFSS
jgi:hypothetical protein